MWLQQPGRCHTVQALRVAEIFVLICSEIEMAFVEIYFGRISLYLFFSISSLLVGWWQSTNSWNICFFKTGKSDLIFNT